MKFDLIVYGRGVERLDGYQLFASPSYWTEEMLMYLTSFSQLWSDIDDETKKPEAWSKTYLFVCLPPPYCCTLLHCVRVEGKTPNTWLSDDKDREIWSLEGWCCRPEQRDYFFPLLPSLILWMEQNHTSLYHRLQHQEISTTLELPEQLIFNPYSQATPPELLDVILANENEKWNWLALCQKIYLSIQPFQFLYGELAQEFAKQIAHEYQIQEIFSSGSPEMEHPPASDPLQKMNLIAKQDRERMEHTYHLRLHLTMEHKKNRDFQARRWGIYERKEENDILESPWSSINPEQGIPMIQLLGEADGVRDFAKKMQWETSLDTAEAHQLYTFKKED